MKSKNQKCEEGAVRNTAWRKLSPHDQLTSLDQRLGKGVGATRQRTNLLWKLMDALLQPPLVTELKPERRHKKGKAK